MKLMGTALFRDMRMCDCAYLCAILATFLNENDSLIQSGGERRREKKMRRGRERKR